MAKRRAHELSKELGLEMKQLISIAERVGVVIKNNMTGIEDEEVDAINRCIEALKRERIEEKRVGSGIIRRRAVRKTTSSTEEESTAALSAEGEPQGESSADGLHPFHEPEAGGLESDHGSEGLIEEAPLKGVLADETVSPSSVTELDTSLPEAPVPEESTLPETVAANDLSAPVETVSEALVQTPSEAEPAEMTEESKADSENDPLKRKTKKVKQISKIIKRIDLDEIVAPRPQPRQPGPWGPRPGGPQNSSFGGRSGGTSTGSGRRVVTINPADVPIPPPSADGPVRRKGKFDKPAGPEEAAARGGRGFRKRQVIDDTYNERRVKAGGKRRGFESDEPQHTRITTPKAIKRVIKLASDTIVVSELAKRMGVKANEVIFKLIKMGLRVMVNQAIDLDTAILVASEFGFEVENVAFEEEAFLSLKTEDPAEQLQNRPPVVTVMGHVDHGKTSILDYIRKTNVTASEAGGITQHIGAYMVRREKGTITFLDTPGHEAFTAMRARGAQITDIVVLVVAADDGVMPQTVEAINHARAAGVPMIVAINKVDKPSANPDRVRQELIQKGVVPEDFGGDTIMVPVSAKSGQGIDHLLEMILLQSEVLELKANPTREQAEAIVIEGKLDRGRGPVGSVLVRHGTLKVGDYFVCGHQSGKIKALLNDAGQRVAAVGPSEPAEVLGFMEVPSVGDNFNTLQDEKQAKAIAENRYRKKRESELAKTSRVSLEELVERVKIGEMQTLSIVLKGDVQGTVEALRDALLKLSSDEVKVTILYTGVGSITESDVLFATASKAIIVGFNVRAENKAQETAEKERVQIKIYNIIYDAIEDIRAAILGLTAPKTREENVGLVEVRNIFTFPKVGTVAGSYVLEGKATRGCRVRLLRENIVVYTGKAGSLRRFKEDVAEVQAGYECGLSIDGFNDIRVGDRLEFFKDVEIPPS